MAEAQGISVRYVRMAVRLWHAAPDLFGAVHDGDISLIAADRIVRDRTKRAKRLHRIVADGYTLEQKHDLARRAAAAAPNDPVRLRRWWQAVVAVRAIPDETLIDSQTMHTDPALIYVQAAIGAAVLGYDPMETEL